VKRQWIRILTSILVIAVFPLWPIAASAASGTYLSNVNAEVNKRGIVTISGCINKGPGHGITAKVIAPDGSLAYVDETASKEDGNFSFITSLAGSKAGRYQVMVGAVGILNTVRTYFEYYPDKTGSITASVDATASIDRSNKVTISGSISTGGGQQLTVLIKDPADKTEFVDHGISRSGGKYEFSYIMKNPLKGRYRVAIGSSGLASPAFTYFDYGMDASLKALSIAGQTLSPVFDPVTTFYTVFSDKAVKTVNVSAIPNDDKARLRINEADTVYGAPSAPIMLAEGKNIISVQVTAQDGITVRSYSIIVEKREAANITAAVKAGINKDKRVMIMGAIGSGAGRQVTVKITDPAGKTEYVGSTSSRSSGEFSLEYTMSNRTTGRYYVTVGAGGMRSVAETYFIYDPSNADLKSLSVQNVQLEPGFSPEITKYSGMVYDYIWNTRVKAEANNEDQTITVNGIPVKSGKESDGINLYTGLNTVRVKVTSPDGTNSKTYFVDVERRTSASPSSRPVLSGNADLSSLVLDGATYEEPSQFTSSITEYLVVMNQESNTITVTPTASGDGAQITVNGIPVTSQSPSPLIEVAAEEAQVDIVVTAEDGTRKKYILTIVRREQPSGNADLSSLLLDGATYEEPMQFAPSITEYLVVMEPGSNTMTITPTASGDGARITVNGTPVANQSPSTPIEVAAEEVQVNIVVTAEDGTRKEYILTVIRKEQPSGNADLSSLVLDGAIYEEPSQFTSSITEYLVVMNQESNTITITPTASDNGAQIIVNGIPVANQSPSIPIEVVTEEVQVGIVVIAEDGTRKEYILTVIKQ
jgi:hypothetical protein